MNSFFYSSLFSVFGFHQVLLKSGAKIRYGGMSGWGIAWNRSKLFEIQYLAVLFVAQ